MIGIATVYLTILSLDRLIMSHCDRQLELSKFLPFYISAIAGRWNAVSSKVYRSHFNLGIGDWRVLAALAALGSATSHQIFHLTNMDIGAVSRSMRKLNERGLVERVAGRFPGHSKPCRLTPAGQDIYSEVEAVALENERLLTRSISDEDRDALLAILSRIYASLDAFENDRRNMDDPA
ncbi:MarR family transcriptional regulator [Altericroceibacterium spongiae]|uniref:MarR family transcriptional regulator n=1 Tax=Altericroceibacterium spongiae TaxID=2320269 RepID=A0A420EQY6_9SPHN|nr:MarR family winged helix-turn-helix transcriptional regulator [Altericroceibacterium spongiae]RKF23094.1 MarR family transcriptional regulator [Altericroceibacterium spongiae]